MTEIDPTDAAAWYWMGCTIPDTSNQVEDPKERLKAIKEKSKQEIALLGKALELNPYLTPAVYRFYMASRFVMSTRESKEWLQRFQRINPDQPESVPAPGPGDQLGKSYGAMGRYGNVVNPFPRLETVEASKMPGPQFESARPLDVKLADGRALGEAGLTSRARPRSLGGLATGSARRSRRLMPTATASSIFI